MLAYKGQLMEKVVRIFSWKSTEARLNSLTYLSVKVFFYYCNPAWFNPQDNSDLDPGRVSWIFFPIYKANFNTNSNNTKYHIHNARKVFNIVILLQYDS